MGGTDSNTFITKISNICIKYPEIVENIILHSSIIKELTEQFYKQNLINYGYYKILKKLYTGDKLHSKKVKRNYSLDSDMSLHIKNKKLYCLECNDVSLGFYISLLIKYIKLTKKENKNEQQKSSYISRLSK